METSDLVDTPMVEKSKLDADPHGKEVDPIGVCSTRRIPVFDWLPYVSDCQYHFIKEQVKIGVVELYFVRTEYQLADILTKALGRERLEFLINKLGMRSMSSKMLKSMADEKEE
ncbi:hypothetical protein Tco_0437931 [Tanacetum coccineum]